MNLVIAITFSVIIAIGLIYYIADLKHNVQELKSDCRQKDTELRNAQEKLQQAIANTNTEKALLLHQLNGKDVDLQSSQDQIQQLNRLLNDRNATITDLNGKLQLMQFGNADITRRLKDAEDQINSLKYLLEAERKRNNELAGMEITPEFLEARKAVYDKDIPFVFISGGAGTGKSQFIKYVLQANVPDLAVVAPTGLAARNANGRTIHSLFAFKPAPYATLQSIPKSYSRQQIHTLLSIKTLVIDEISMVRADLLDLIDAALRKLHGSTLPFGGVKIVAVGDLHQLPPVVDDGVKSKFNADASVAFEHWKSPFFFSAEVMQNREIKYCRFTKQFRQKDELDYCSMLNTIRTTVSQDALDYFNKRHDPSAPPSVPRIFPTNNAVDSYNEKMLTRLPGNTVSYKATKKGTYHSMRESDLPVPSVLTLKKGAQVMFVKNSGNWRNGTLGVVEDLDPTTNAVLVKSYDDGNTYGVSYDTWEDFQFDRDGKLQLCGEYSQIPLVPAWAFTIHKTQGLTFRELAVDLSKTFDFGMCYVALSRTSNLQNLYLNGRLNQSIVKVSPEVLQFYNSL